MIREPALDPYLVASPAYRPTWRDRWAVRVANAWLRFAATKRYQELARDCYARGFEAVYRERYGEDPEGAA